VEERHGGEDASANLVGQGRDRQFDPFAFEALALPVQRQMLTKFVEQNRRQKLRPDIAPRRRMERRRRLRDRLAVPAGELFAHRVNHFEPARDLLQRRGDALAELRQPRRAAARTLRRSRQNDALPLDVVGIWLAHRPLALERAHGLRLFGCLLGDELILGRGRLELLQLQFQLIEQPR
jgi:hypothetical protein